MQIGVHKVFLQSTKVSVYEIVYPTTGLYREPYRTVCLHKSPGFDFVNRELPLRILIPHYEPAFFDKREFIIEFDDCMYIKFKGGDLDDKMTSKNTIQLLQGKDKAKFST